jgi:hypothetical protein
MSVRPGQAGATRTCPHCKATILESASVCPACRGHLRYDDAAIARAKTAIHPLQIEGTITPPDGDTVYEYSMVLSIKNDRGEEIVRQVVGVGALQPHEKRPVADAVE